jgi:hypothetical protein
MSRFSYRRRTFLAPASTGFTSYVLAEVEASDGGEYTCGHNMLTVADCRQRVELEFLLDTARLRLLHAVEHGVHGGDALRSGPPAMKVSQGLNVFEETRNGRRGCRARLLDRGCRG